MPLQLRGGPGGNIFANSSRSALEEGGKQQKKRLKRERSAVRRSTVPVPEQEPGRQ
jgi:hypothetical protein